MVKFKCGEAEIFDEWISLVRGSNIRFTRYAREKFEFVRRYGFNLDEKQVI